MIKKINYYISAIMIIILSVYILIALLIWSETRSMEEMIFLFVILTTLLFSGYTLYKPSGMKSSIAVTAIGLLLLFFIAPVAHQIGAYSLIPIAILIQILVSIVMRLKEKQHSG